MPIGSLAAACLAVLMASLAAPARAADPVLSGGIADLTGPRALGLGASVGVLSGNDGVFVNPAAVAARRRYSMETLFTVDRRGSTSVGRYVGGSVVDALSNAPSAFSFAYLRSLEAAQAGNLFTLGLATPVADRLYLGAQARWLSLKGAEQVNAVTADAGLFWEVSSFVSVGVAGYNLVPVGHELAAPRGVGAGISLGSDTSFKVTADWRANFDRLGKTTNRYGAGAELLLGSMFPVRGGYLKDETLDTSWWTAGAGLIASNGVAIDVGYRQSLDASDARQVSVAIKVFVLEL